jgi:hypothetical protein
MADESEIAANGMVDSRLLLSMLRDIRREQRETRDLLVSLTQHVLGRFDDLEKRMTARIDDLKEELQLMLKAEVLGRISHLETRLDEKLDELLTH